MSQGTFLAIAFSTFSTESREALPFAPAGKKGMSLFQPCGNLLIRRAIRYHRGLWDTRKKDFFFERECQNFCV